MKMSSRSAIASARKRSATDGRSPGASNRSGTGVPKPVVVGANNHTPVWKRGSKKHRQRSTGRPSRARASTTALRVASTIRGGIAGDGCGVPEQSGDVFDGPRRGLTALSRRIFTNNAVRLLLRQSGKIINPSDNNAVGTQADACVPIPHPPPQPFFEVLRIRSRDAAHDDRCIGRPFTAPTGGRRSDAPDRERPRQRAAPVTPRVRGRPYRREP